MKVVCPLQFSENIMRVEEREERRVMDSSDTPEHLGNY